jgi:hypothetical protein
MTDAQPSSPAAYRAPLFLFVVATLIPELLIGSTPLSRINTLLFQFPYYGSAALVIREVVIRRGLSRTALLLLGLAFGTVSEGLSLQSVFNPDFLHLDITFGRAGGVNWPWAIYMVAYHAIWSITLPITLTGLLFRDRRDQPWLGRVATGVFLLLFVLMAFAFHATFVKMSGFRAPTGPYLAAAALVTLLVIVALGLKRRDAPAGAPSTRAWLAGVMMFGFGLIWLMLYGEIFRHPPVTPVTWNLLLALVIAIGFVGSIPRWAPENATEGQRLWQVAGGLAANTLFGFVVVSHSSLDTAGQVGVALLVVVGLFALAHRLRTSPAGHGQMSA